jgi:hypothetical protein
VAAGGFDSGKSERSERDDAPVDVRTTVNIVFRLA